MFLASDTSQRKLPEGGFYASQGAEAGLDQPSPFLSAVAAVSVLGAARAAHAHLLRHRPEYASKLFKFARSVEEKSPYHIARTFGISDLYSSYLVPDQIVIPYSELVENGALTNVGGHLHRLIGDAVDIRSQTEGLTFNWRDKGDPFMDLAGHEGVKVRFANRGVRTESSFRYGAPLEPEAIQWPKGEMSPLSRVRQSFKAIQHSQKPKGYEESILGGRSSTAEGAGEFSPLNYFQPYMAKVESRSGLIQGEQQYGRLLFEKMERGQRLMADVGFGLQNRAYNKLFHIPFAPGELGRGGLLNNLLSKRALPFYLALGVVLPFVDYQTDHAISGAAIDALQGAQKLRAHLTDAIPGLRSVTDSYEDIVPGNQYGPLALPIAGMAAGGVYHYSKVLAGKFTTDQARRNSGRILAREGEEAFLKFFNKKSPVAVGLAIGAALALPFVPGMLGSRKTADELDRVYSGEEMVPIKTGRWWDMGTTPLEGARIKEWRPHWSVLWKTQAEKKSLYGSEENYWGHHPVLHPLNYLKDPYYLEERNYADRPYPVTSPAFTNVPLVGPLLAATVGKLVKPPVFMHEDEWDRKDYSLYSTRLEPRGDNALPPPEPGDEFSLWEATKSEILAGTEFPGLPGFITRSIYNAVVPDTNKGHKTFLQGSRQMDNFSRRYYEAELGAAMGPNPSGDSGLFGYSEPFRRFVQRETGLAQANEIPNKMPSWLPGDDYFMNFRVGDPYIRVSNGYARLPGAGYEALHPELEGLDPEQYPDVTKLSILADVAPYSKEYATYRGRVSKEARGDTELQIEYEKILERVRQTRESIIQVSEKKFSAEVEQIEGAVSAFTPEGVELQEYPGRVFKLSGVGSSAADLSSVVLSEHNDYTKSQVANEVEIRHNRLQEFLNDELSSGTFVRATVPKGAVGHSQVVRAVLEVNGQNLNQELIDQGLGQFRKDLSGPEVQAMYTPAEQMLGRFAEEASFTGDEEVWNPLRYIPSPAHTKLWQNRTAYAQYLDEEVIGTRMRRWERPIHDFLMPYAEGAVRRTTGEILITDGVQHKRDLNTMVDMLRYLRGEELAAENPEDRGRYTSQASRTSIGANMFGTDTFVASTLPDRDPHYFRHFLNVTDTAERKKILEVVPSEMSRALTAKWITEDAAIARAEGRDVPDLGEGGRLYDADTLKAFQDSGSKLDYGNFERSQEIAQFFSRTGLNLPGPESSLWDPNIDYEDVKLKIIQQEGYDAHDFNIFDDRSALLWRKPYIDGAVRELTSGNDRSSSQIRYMVEQMMLGAQNPNAKITVTGHASEVSRANVTVDVDLDERDQLYRDMRRNPENYD